MSFRTLVVILMAVLLIAGVSSAQMQRGPVQAGFAKRFYSENSPTAYDTLVARASRDTSNVVGQWNCSLWPTGKWTYGFHADTVRKADTIFVQERHIPDAYTSYSSWATIDTLTDGSLYVGTNKWKFREFTIPTPPPILLETRFVIKDADTAIIMGQDRWIASW
jgi:hypothetical protein